MSGFSLPRACARQLNRPKSESLTKLVKSSLPVKMQTYQSVPEYHESGPDRV
jgi:hypothetical protein